MEVRRNARDVNLPPGPGEFLDLMPRVTIVCHGKGDLIKACTLRVLGSIARGIDLSTCSVFLEHVLRVIADDAAS